jgi:hypothetical protein
MPVTKSRNGINEMFSLDQTNTTRFLFGDDETSSSPDQKSYLQMNANDENFPILVRRDEYAQKVRVNPPKVIIHVLIDLCSYPHLLLHLTLPLRPRRVQIQTAGLPTPSIVQPSKAFPPIASIVTAKMAVH